MNDNTTNNIGALDPIQAALLDSANYLDHEDWFRLLQEDGTDFTEGDVAMWEKNPKKKKSVHITLRCPHVQ